METKFVGRKEELDELIQYAVSRENIVYCLYSDSTVGGVGKTSIALKLKEELPENVTSLYIDFDNVKDRNIERVMDEIVNKLGSSELKKDYKDAVNSLALVNQNNVKKSLVAGKDRIFKEVCSKYTGRFLVILDTFERFVSSIFLEKLLDLVGSISKFGMVLVCGRLNNSFRERLYKKSPLYFEKKIDKLTTKEVHEYLSQKPSFQISDELKSKLEILTQKPLILDLALAWVGDSLAEDGMLKIPQKWPGKAILTKSQRELRNNLKGYQEEFEREIVSGVVELSSPIDYCIMYMSMIEFPFDQEAIRFVIASSFKLRDMEIQKLDNKLNDIFFVRGNYVLHEEMKFLIRKYVWPDKEKLIKGELYRDLSKFIKAQQQKTLNVPELFEWELQELILKFNMGLDQEAAGLSQKLIDKYVIPTINNPIRSPRQRGRSVYDIWRKEAEETINGKYLAIMVMLIEDVNEDELNRYATLGLKENPALQVNILNNLASKIRDNQPARAVDLYQKSLKIIESNQLGRKWDVLRYLGMCYRRMARFEDAHFALTKSIEESQSNNAVKDMASAMNVRAYVDMELGNMEEAIHYVRLALEYREDDSPSVDVAYSYMSLGELYLEQNRFDAARESLSKAQVIFENEEKEDRIPKSVELARIKILLAKVSRSNHRPIDADNYMKEAFDILESMQQIDKVCLSDAKNERGCEFRKRGRELSKRGVEILNQSREFLKNKEQRKAKQAKTDANKIFAQADEMFSNARILIDESIKLIRNASQITRLVDNLSDLALVYQYWYENSNYWKGAKKKNQQLIAEAHRAAKNAIYICRQHGELILYESRALETLGDIAYSEAMLRTAASDDPRKVKATRDRKFFRAFARYYLPACLLLANFYSVSMNRRSRVFDRVHKKIINKSISPRVVRATADYMSRRWKEESKDSIAPGFINIYSNIAETWNVGR